VLATGACDTPLVPREAAQLAPSVAQVVPPRYRRPADLPPGGVLVVGASATGVQLADELHRAGREVVLATGRHTRMPRRYRGRDIMWWLDAMGVWDQPAGAVRELERARWQPSLQLVGRPDHASLDLAALVARGVRVTGRLVGVDGVRVGFADDLAASTAAADAKLARLSARIDEFIAAAGIDDGGPPPPPPPVRVGSPLVELDLAAAGISTVLWATGYRRSYSWLRVPVVDAQGELRHDGGVTPAPGLYALGLPFMRRRKSNFIDGVGDDARDLTAHIAHTLGADRRRIAA